MKIISKHNKKDFYDYSGFGHDTSNDIVYARTTETILLDKKSELIKYFFHKAPGFFNWNLDKYYLSHVVVGIYPYCYFIPFITDNIDEIMTKQQIVFPYEITNDIEKINAFLRETNSNIQITTKRNLLSHLRSDKIAEKWKDEELFRRIEAPVFLYYSPSEFCLTGDNYIIKNIIFNEQVTNWLKYIKDDLDQRDVYTDIENYLWSMKQEPISEPDNETKIVSHGFDLKTSFRKM